MPTYIFEIVSHRAPAPEDVLTGESQIVADHVLGASAFTADVAHHGKIRSQHRFGVLVMADPVTAHSMTMTDQLAVSVITGLLDRFKEVLEEIFGEGAFRLAVMQGILEGVVTKDVLDDLEDIEPDVFGDTLN